MARIRILAVCLVLVLINAKTAGAQEPPSRREFWPEINVYVNLKPKLRLFLLGTVSKIVEDGENGSGKSFEAQIGGNVDYLPNKHVVLRAGYRYGWSLRDDSYREHRLLTEQTFRTLVPGGMLLSDRSREDFRFLQGDYSFRYRNRLTIEREFQLKKRTITPYVSGEIFYDTRYGIWNRNRVNAGAVTSLRNEPNRQILLDLYYSHQNDSRSTPNKMNAVGVNLIFYF